MAGQFIKVTRRPAALSYENLRDRHGRKVTQDLRPRRRYLGCHAARASKVPGGGDGLSASYIRCTWNNTRGAPPPSTTRWLRRRLGRRPRKRDLAERGTHLGVLNRPRRTAAWREVIIPRSHAQGPVRSKGSTPCAYVEIGVSTERRVPGWRANADTRSNESTWPLRLTAGLGARSRPDPLTMIWAADRVRVRALARGPRHCAECRWPHGAPRDRIHTRRHVQCQRARGVARISISGRSASSKQDVAKPAISCSKRPPASCPVAHGPKNRLREQSGMLLDGDSRPWANGSARDILTPEASSAMKKRC